MSILGQTLVKVAISSGRLRVSQARKGRRPMSVDTLLRKEKDGTLYKEAESVEEKVQDLRQRISGLVGVDPAELGRGRIVSSTFGRMKEGLKELVEPSLAEKISAAHQVHHPEYYEVGPAESKVPWYATALGGTGGALVGQRLLKKRPVAGALLGTLAGTGLGLEAGTALGRKIDVMRKKAGSQQPMQRMFGEGAARGIDNYIMQDFGLGGKPATSKVKPGDAPSRDEAPSYITPGKETMPGTNRSMDLAMKVAGAVMARLVNQDEDFPTSDQGERVDPSNVHRKEHSAFQNAGADSLTTEWNPDWRKR